MAGWMPCSGDLGKLDCIQYYVGDICVDHLQHTESDVIVEEMGSSEENGALLITVMMQMQPFRNYLLERMHRLIIECSVPAGMRIF